MARQPVSHRRPGPPPPRLDPAAQAVIESYLDRLAAQLPRYAPLDAGVAAELRDDLLAATTDRMPGSADPANAARAALEEFGRAEAIADSLRPELATRLARRLGLGLLASGPLVGGCWLLALLVDAVPVWRWLPLLAAPLLLVGAPAVALTVASTGRFARWFRPPTALASGAVAGAAAGVGDLVLLGGGAVLLLTPVAHPSPLLVLAVGASVARLGFIARAALRLRGAQHALSPPVTA